MKQFFFLSILLALLSACGNKQGVEGSSNLSNQMDSISYQVGRYFAEQYKSIGISLNAPQMGQGVLDANEGKSYLSEEEGIAFMTNMQQVMAMRQGAPFTSPDSIPFSLDTLSYAMGSDFAKNMAEYDITVTPAAMVQGVLDFTKGEVNLIGESGDELLMALTGKINEKQQAMMAEKAEVNIEAGKKFIAEKAAEEGVKSTASGLHYKVIQEGTGAQPTAEDAVTVHYEGRLIDGTVFDSSIARGEPISFPLNGVIPGWTEGVQLMKEGAKYQFYIPQELAYGLQSPPSIPPGSTLVFDVELIKIGE
ncbi:MAG: FKBP-type peptidyl-prolyl cis-trans isomerase [Saprospiraceae bacterium]